MKTDPIGAMEQIANEECRDWHTDSLISESDYWLVDNIREKSGEHWHTIVGFAAELDKIVPKFSIADAAISQSDDAEIARNASLMASVGYNKYNTAHYRAYSDAHPNVFDPILTICDLAEPIGSLTHQKPGTVNPWHYDTFAFYARKFGIADRRSVRRHLVFLEDWHWGHYLLIGNSVVHQWRAGDMITWPYRRQHLSANAGVIPKLTLQVTGRIRPL